MPSGLPASPGLCGEYETEDPWAEAAGDPGRSPYTDDIVYDTGRFTAFPVGVQR